MQGVLEQSMAIIICLNVTVLLFAFYLHHCMYSVYKTFKTQFLLFLSRQPLTTALRVDLKTLVCKIAVPRF